MDQLSAELFETIKGEGEPIRFSPEEHQKCKESLIKFSKTESEIERITREERVAAAAKPVYFTF